MKTRYEHMGKFTNMAGEKFLLMECLTCGAVVGDRHSHDLWHEPLDSLDSEQDLPHTVGGPKGD